MTTDQTQCPNCYAQNPGTVTFCFQCGAKLPITSSSPMPPLPPMPPPGISANIPGADKKLAAGLCGILIGGLGVHKFILGYNQEGLIMLLANLISAFLFVLSCGLLFPLIFVSMAVGTIGLVEGIMYLTKSDEEFVQTYIVNKRPWF